MLKKIMVLAGIAAAVAVVKKKQEKDQAGKDLWAQAADNPTSGSRH